MKKKIIRSRLYVSYVAVLSLLISSSVFAAHPLITDDSDTQGIGKYQVEINGEYTNDNGDTATEMAASSTVQRKILTSTSA